MMRVTYDPEVDALYIRFLEGPIEVTTHRLSEDVAIDYGPDGRIVGIEVLDASDYALGQDAEPRIVVTNLTPVRA